MLFFFLKDPKFKGRWRVKVYMELMSRHHYYDSKHGSDLVNMAAGAELRCAAICFRRMYYFNYLADFCFKCLVSNADARFWMILKYPRRQYTQESILFEKPRSHWWGDSATDRSQGTPKNDSGDVTGWHGNKCGIVWKVIFQSNNLLGSVWCFHMCFSSHPSICWLLFFGPSMLISCDVDLKLMLCEPFSSGRSKFNTPNLDKWQSSKLFAFGETAGYQSELSDLSPQGKFPAF